MVVDYIITGTARPSPAGGVDAVSAGQYTVASSERAVFSVDLRHGAPSCGSGRSRRSSWTG
jgi:hypothetical protein